MKTLFLIVLCLLCQGLGPAQALATQAPVRGCSESLTICSFNIQFLGSFKSRDNEALANLIRDQKCDVAVIQELVAPPSEKYLARNQLNPFTPYPKELFDRLSKKDRAKFEDPSSLFMWPGDFSWIAAIPPNMSPVEPPSGETCQYFPENIHAQDVPLPIETSETSTRFFEAMEKAGYPSFMISEEDTGPKRNHTNGTASEWWVAFYNDQKLKVAKDLPNGFLSAQVTQNPDFDRVPYAFPFRTVSNRLDFVLISMHTHPGDGRDDIARRKEELAGLTRWRDQNCRKEAECIALGDMNFEAKEAATFSPAWQSLNAQDQPTNTIPRPISAKPYDHVLFSPTRVRKSILPRQNFEVINLIEHMRARWKEKHPDEPYPGGGDKIAIHDGTTAEFDYFHDGFRTEYSDHHPIKFRLCVPQRDSDRN